MSDVPEMNLARKNSEMRFSEKLSDAELGALVIRWLCQVGQALDAAARTASANASAMADLAACEAAILSQSNSDGSDTFRQRYEQRYQRWLAGAQIAITLLSKHGSTLKPTKVGLPSREEMQEFVAFVEHKVSPIDA